MFEIAAKVLEWIETVIKSETFWYAVTMMWCLMLMRRIKWILQYKERKAHEKPKVNLKKGS